MAGAVACFVLFTLVYNVVRWWGDIYILPRNGDDWAAWAGWLSLLATAGAVTYAAFQFQSDVQEKRSVRAKSEEEARKAAEYLALRASPTNPADPDYPTDRPNPAYVDGVTLYITNYGSEAFKDIQVKIPDVKAEVTSVSSGPEDIFRAGHPDEAPAWVERPEPQLLFPEQQLWSCGDLPPLTILRVSITLDEIEEDGRWDPSEDGITGRIAVIFTDHLGRSWVRSTEKPKRLQRLWPESIIAERR